jgi:hypothetical protein
MLCPNCKQDAPIIYRGLNAYCTACGQPRSVLSSPSVTMAGQPAKVGGVVVKTLSYVVLAVGTGFSLLMGLLFSLVSSGTGLTAGLVFAALTLAISLPMMFGGKKLEQTGADEQNAKRSQAVFALAANRGGILRPADVAGSLQIPMQAADELLTHLAKTRGDEIDVDVTEHGEVVYKFPRLLVVGPSQWTGSGQDKVRVEAPRRAAAPPAPSGVVDSEFEESDEAPGQHHAKGEARR